MVSAERRFSLLMALRTRLAFRSRMIVCRVSGTVKMRSSHHPPVMAISTQKIYRQPGFRAMYPLITSAMGGPKVLLSPYTAIGPPLSLRTHRSLMEPPVLVNGAPPAHPAMKRHTITVPMLGARAMGSWKRKSRNQDTA